MIWTGTWVLLTSKDLITPDLPHSTLAGAGVWCQTLQGSSTLERHKGSLLPVSHPHTCRWHPLGLADAGLGSLCSKWKTERLPQHPMFPLHAVWKAIGTVTKFNQSSSSMLTHFYIFRCFLFICFYSCFNFNMLPSLSPKREWILKQGDQISWKSEFWAEWGTHVTKDRRAAVLIRLDSYSDATDFTEIPDCLVPGKSRNSQCKQKDLIKTTRGKVAVTSYHGDLWELNFLINYCMMTTEILKDHKLKHDLKVECTFRPAGSKYI